MNFRDSLSFDSGPNVISLFSGAGGLDIGLEQAGFVCLAANELTPYACETLRANQLLGKMERCAFDDWFKTQLSQRCYFNADPREITSLKMRLLDGVGKHSILSRARIIPGDLRQISSPELLRLASVGSGELTLVAGGPPCQPFSRAGKRLALDVDEGVLFKEFVRIVADLKPRWFLFENVKGLILTKTEVLRIKCSHCRKSSLAHLDIRLQSPENRKRPSACVYCGSGDTSWNSAIENGGSLSIILNEFERIGYKCYSEILNAADYGAPQMRERLFIVGSRDHEAFSWPKRTHIKPSDKNSTQLAFSMDDSCKQPWRSLVDIWPNGHPKLGRLDPRKAVLWVKNVVRPHDEPVTWNINRPSPTIGAHQSAKLAIAPDGVPDEQLQRQQWHTKGKRQGDAPPVPVAHEYLSDIDLLRLQTFPDYWYLFGTRMQRASQIGNAVPIILAEAVGRAILAASAIKVKPTDKALEYAHH
jgi:DNA (cytosine-5)-methyltransferase 1